jgi:archaeal flagellar protein FlaJ
MNWLNQLMFWKKNKQTPGQENKNSDDMEYLEMDFFCQLSYMAAIATSGIDRGGLFNHAAKLPYISARYFKRVVFVAKAFNHDYAEACNIVGQATKEPMIKELLLRLSGALSSGENMADFLERESEVFSETYSNSYSRKLESLSRWTDAYIALIMTTAIVTVMAVVTLMIGNATVAFIVSLSIVTIVVTIAGAWFIFKATPKETRVHTLKFHSKEQDLARLIAKIILPAGGLVILVMLVTKVNLGVIFLTAAAALCPLGLVSKIDDIKIGKRDADVAGFLRSLGSVSQATGITVNEAMGRLDFRSIGSLVSDVNLLFTRLLARIDPSVCWERFVCDTGSEQVNRSVRIFWDAVALGGEPRRIGNDASGFAMKIALLRARRGMIGIGFFWLTTVMHAVLSCLLVFIYETMMTFTNLIQKIAPQEDISSVVPNMPTYAMFNTNSGELGLLYFMIVIIIIVLTTANAFTVYSISGGHIFTLAFNMCITVALSGAALLIIPPLVNVLFTAMV